MDIRLAGSLDGIEAARRLRQLAGVPSVFVTAYADDDLLRAAAEVGPYGFVVKPFDERRLHAAIQMALYEHRLEVALREANEALEAKVRARTSQLQEVVQALRVSEARYRTVFEESSDGLALIDLESGAILDCNATLCSMAGRSREDLIGQPERALHPSEEWLPWSIPASFERHRRHAGGDVLDGRVVTRTGETREVEVKVAQLELEGRPVLLTVLRDVSARRQQELALTKALEERDLALREIHHRVKNNLQLVSSLLNLQFGDVSDSRIRDRLHDYQRQVRAIALVHEKLYQSRSLVSIRLDEYLDALAHALLLPDNSSLAIDLRVRAQPVELGIDRALKVGLIVNELVTNAVKHGFGPDDRGGWVEVALSATRQGFTLAVANSGQPFTTGGQAPATGFGLSLVSDLVEDLGAQLQIRDEPHPCVEVRVPTGPNVPDRA